MWDGDDLICAHRNTCVNEGQDVLPVSVRGWVVVKHKDSQSDCQVNSSICHFPVFDLEISYLTVL